MPVSTKTIKTRTTRREKIYYLIIIVTMLCGISTYGLNYSLAQGNHEYYQIENVEHVKDFNNLPNNLIDKQY
jgi:hypothetical protein